ncbi:MAG: AAA family ATPase [Methylacidiphilaceae bacterium]|nr:AAA family ATPase [Candidatus Methylacidiphilaceae bacterium]
MEERIYDPDNRPDVFGLRPFLKARIIGQDRALDSLCDAVENSECQLGGLGESRPRGSFLCVGTTGVGKTETAKLMGEYFYPPEFVKVFHMSGFQHENDVTKFVGDEHELPGGGENLGELGEFLSQYSDEGGVIVFDEVEKANPKLRTLFLQMLEPGQITCGAGVSFDLSPFYLFFTSNVGAQRVMHASTAFRQLTLERNFRHSLANKLSPELVNRVDAILVYKKLLPKEMRQIVRLHLDRYLAEVGKRHGTSITYDASVVDFLLVRARDRWFGARHVVKEVQRYVATPLRERMREGEVISGRLTVQSGRIVLVAAEGANRLSEVCNGHGGEDGL